MLYGVDFEIKILENGRAAIYTPFNPVFKNIIKNIGLSHWDFAEKCWVVPAHEITFLRNEMVRVYGRSDVDYPEILTIRLTTIKDIELERQSIIVFNKCLAYVTGRDSGATVENDVTFIKGAPKSGGSMAHWKSMIPKDSIIQLYNVNPDVYKEEIESGKWERIFNIEIIDNPKPKKDILLKEKERLKARLDEIDKMLEQIDN